MYLDVLFGPIASGKSTYAENRARAGDLIANDDAIVMAVHGGVYGAYDKGLKPLYKMLGLQIIHHAATDGKNVVVDSTGLRRSTRTRFAEVGRSLGFITRLVVFRNGEFLGAEDGVRRFRADSRGMSLESWVNIGEHHAATVEPVDPWTEEFDEFLKIPWK